MLTAEVSKFGEEFIRCLDAVKNGEGIFIAESGKIIGRITKEEVGDSFISQAIRPLISEGLVICPTRPIDRNISLPVTVSGKPVSEMVTEDRR